ncbi:hypothetical protein L7F22_036139 [Adiantum nelumboides]|nr:hypothetical protein [Adiantum nelumboides]
MPTASTSQILGNNECFEPYTSNIYSRRVLSGEFVVVNKHLLNDLTDMGLWSLELKNKIIVNNGSIQNVDKIPENLKAVYKTVWEIKQRTIVDMAADRGCYIDQSQSLNIHMDQPNFGKLTSLHFYTWSKESAKSADDNNEAKMAQMVYSIKNRDECLHVAVDTASSMALSDIFLGKG